MTAYRFFIHGRVQGVGYRYYALRHADSLGLSGFARNLPDGRVEVVAEGDDASLQELELRLREGPAFGSVEHVERTAIAPRGSQGFHIR